MRIIWKRPTAYVARFGMMEEGESYEVPTELGLILVKWGQAEAAELEAEKPKRKRRTEAPPGEE